MTTSATYSFQQRYFHIKPSPIAPVIPLHPVNSFLMRSNDSQKIIVVGIPKTLDDAELSELFSDFGTVIEAKVVLDTTSNTSRGFGFVTFTAASAMRNAIKGMNRKVIEGRTLNVRQLVPKETFQAQKKETPDKSERPCWLLRKGKCTEGANCPFSHDIKDGEFGNCFEFVQTGECKHGDKCKFSHPEREEEEDEGEMEMKKKERTNGEKRVCYSFQNGRCHRGKKCLYVHEMLGGGDTESAGKEKKKKEVVKRQSESGNKRKRLEEREEKEGVRVKTEKKVVKVVTKNIESEGPKKLEWKAKAQTSEPKEEPKQEQGREVEVEEPQQQHHRPKNMKVEKVDMGAAFDGVSDDETRPRHGDKKKKVDKETMHANREKLMQERRAKRNAKKMALSKLRNKGEVELLA